MSTPATGSTEIALVDSRIYADLCAGKFFIDASPTIYIGSGETTVLGANVEIINPYGVTIKPYGPDYEIAPDLSGEMDAVVSFNVPTQAGNFLYGKYTINVEMFDSTGASWIVSKTVSICAPDRSNKTKNYGSLSAMMKINCVDGKMFVIVDNVPTYKGYLVESQVITGTLEYPTASELPPLSVTTGAFSVILFEGVYKLVAEICATYNFTDNVFARVKYKIKKELNARCLIDECCVYDKLAELQLRTGTDCTEAEKQATASTIVEALNLFELAKLAGRCGEDPSEWITQLEDLLGCECTCNCNEGAPVINTDPSGDVIIEGCNVEVVTVGLTKTYTINNYEYKVEIAANGGALTVSSATLAGCTKTQAITFDVSVVYSQIKTLANQNNTEADLWAAIINKALRDVDPACLGITSLAWQALTFAEKQTAILTKMCACCVDCDGTISNAVAAETGADSTLTWEGTADSYEVYLDGALSGTYLASAAVSGTFTHVFAGAADGVLHTWIIIAKCSNGTQGEIETGTFQFIGCPVIAAPIGASGSSSACPFDLTSVSFTIPAGTTVEWHTANSTSVGTIVSNPLAVLGGSYYAFAKDANGCYSASKKYDLVCASEASCSAPQNLLVSEVGGNNFFIQFQSAAYPPPSNSYTVKRRLYSAPDIGGSYTTIGTPTWNASLNRWVLIDSSAVNNTLYVYRAISNCGSTEPSIDYTYARITCPTLTLTPSTEIIDYSFVPVGGGVDKYEVSIYDSSGTVLIHTDTFTPSFSNPTTGTFSYLTAATTYMVAIKIFIGTYSKTCTAVSVTTDSSINGTINVLTGVRPVSIGAPNGTGTITATTGSTVNVRLSMGGTDAAATMSYNVNGIVGTLTNASSPITLNIVMPGSSINWSISLTTTVSSETGTIELT